MQQKVSEDYIVTEGNTTARIHVTINNDDEITITNDKKQPQFSFTRSQPEMIAAMGQAFEEAYRLIESRKEKAA